MLFSSTLKKSVERQVIGLNPEFIKFITLIKNMRNLKFSIIIALFAFAVNVFGQSKAETEVVFKFIQQSDGFFYDINSSEIIRLHGYVDKYKTEISSKKIMV